MAIFHLTPTAVEPITETTFGKQGIRERSDLQRLLKSNIQIIAPDVLVIAEEFGDWEDSKRRIDLLAIDHDANLVVIELKRDDDGHMELQALRYAAMVSTMTFAKAVGLYQDLLDASGVKANAHEKLLEFLNWDEPREDDFAREVRIILAAASFSKELTTTVLWLNDRALDIRCVRIKPYELGDNVIVDVQQIVPLPEATEYQVRLREKSIVRREALRQSGDDTGYFFMNVGEAGSTHRLWEECRQYCFMTAGGGPQWSGTVKKLAVGDLVFAYVNGAGYVGLARVVSTALPHKDFRLPTGQRLIDMPLKTPHSAKSLDDLDTCDWCVGVEWLAALDRHQGILKSRAYRGTFCKIRQQSLVDDLLAGLHVPATSI